MRRIALMTGGGDCAGLNAFLASVAHRAIHQHGFSVCGIRDAFEGACASRPEDYVVPLEPQDLVGLKDRPSTILGSSRFAPFSEKNRAKGVPDRLIANLDGLGISGVILTGGDDTLRTAMHLSAAGVPVIAAPKGIDNDVSGTDVMLGYATAVDFGVRAMRGAVESARTHRRISVVEVMGRAAGWLTLETGIGGGADVILIPERPVELERVAERVGQIYTRQGYCSIAMAEGVSIAAQDPALLRTAARSEVVKAMISADVTYDDHGNPKLGGVGTILRHVLWCELGLRSLENVRGCDLGFILRGQEPVAADIILATRFGIAAADLLAAGVSGKMMGLRGTRVEPVDIAEGLVQNTVNWSDIELASVGVL